MSVRDLRRISQKGWVRTSAIMLALPLLLLIIFLATPKTSQALPTSCVGEGGTGEPCEEGPSDPCYGVNTDTTYSLVDSGEIISLDPPRDIGPLCMYSAVPLYTASSADYTISDALLCESHWKCVDGERVLDWTKDVWVPYTPIPNPNPMGEEQQVGGIMYVDSPEFVFPEVGGGSTAAHRLYAALDYNGVEDGGRRTA